MGISPWGSAVFWSLLPAGIFVTAPGALDHHGWEAAAFWLAILAIPSRPVLGALAIGLSFHVTPLAPVLAAGYLLSLLCNGIAEYSRKRHLVGESIENAIFVAAVIALPAATEIVSFDAPSLIHVFGFAGAGFFLAGLFSEPVTRWSRFLIAACFLVSAGLPALTLVRGSGFADLFSGLTNPTPWAAISYGIGLASIGWIAIPLVHRRMPSVLFLPSVATFLLAAVWPDYLHLASVPAAWAAMILAGRIALHREKRNLFRFLVIVAFLLPAGVVVTRGEFPPRISDPVLDVIARSAGHFNAHSIVLASPELAGHIVGLTGAMTIADEFHRNRKGRRIWQNLVTQNGDDVSEILNAHRVSAILLTDSLEFHPESYAAILWRDGHPRWHLADGDGTARLYLRQ